MSALELKISPVMLAVGLALLMGWITRDTPVLGPGPADVPGLRAAAALMLGILGLGVGVAGVRAFRRARTTVNPWRPERASSLVETGIYRHTRNPMYLGLLLALLGWSAYLGNLPALLPALGFIPWMNRFQIAPEERALRRAFGEAFEAYCRRVPRWL